MTLDAIRSDFALLDDWEDRYRYVIELGVGCRRSPMRCGPKPTRCAAAPARCGSSATRAPAPAGARFRGDSDAHIVRGLIAILFALFRGKTAGRSWRRPRALFAELGLREHLTPQRSNGLSSMVERIRSDARALAAARADVRPHPSRTRRPS